MLYRLRRFTENDRAAVIAMGDAIYPEYRQHEAWHAAEQFDFERVTSYRYVAECSAIVGYGAIRYLRERQARIDLMVHPEYQRRGAGTKILQRLIQDLRSTECAAAHARVRQDHQEAVSFLQNRGFVEHQRMYGLRLNIGEVPFDDLWPRVSRLALQGIQISTFARERVSDPEWLYKLLDLHNSALPDWPDPESVTAADTQHVASRPASYEDFARRVDREAASRPDALFIAIIENRYIGYSGMFALGTAVRPEFRNRGVATALKVHTIRYAQESQIASAMTCTANPIMLAINEKLGYRRERVEIRMMKPLDQRAIPFSTEP
jgi:GNAT superfamily N-acetyltransferase